VCAFERYNTTAIATRNAAINVMTRAQAGTAKL
jgi:hypothetical protein